MRDEDQGGGGTDRALSGREREKVEERTAPRAVVVHEIVRQEGEEELSRSFSALAWSGLAAGLSMGFSLMLEGQSRPSVDDPHSPVALCPAGYAVIWRWIGYRVDDSSGISDPRGMLAHRFGIDMHVVSADVSVARNLMLSVERCHLDVEAIGTRVEAPVDGKDAPALSPGEADDEQHHDGARRGGRRAADQAAVDHAGRRSLSHANVVSHGVGCLRRRSAQRSSSRCSGGTRARYEWPKKPT